MANSGITLFWILFPLAIAAVVIHLILYGRRRRKMMEIFVKEHHLAIRPELERAVQETLDNCFPIKEPGSVRAFSSISSIVDGGDVKIFRSVELLDLSQYGNTLSGHHNRIAALFKISRDCNEFFIFQKSMQAERRISDANPPDPEIVNILKPIYTSCQAGHALSVTLKNDHGLIYFEPLVTGGEKPEDIDALYCIANKLRKKLSDDA